MVSKSKFEELAEFVKEANALMGYAKGSANVIKPSRVPKPPTQGTSSTQAMAGTKIGNPSTSTSGSGGTNMATPRPNQPGGGLA